MLWALYDRGRQWRFCYCFMLVEFYKGCWFGWFFFVVTKLVNLCSAKVHFLQGKTKIKGTPPPSLEGDKIINLAKEVALT